VTVCSDEHQRCSQSNKIDAVICHDIILARGEDPSAQFAARKASFFALDALEGDAGFMDRTCSCRAQNDAKKAAKKAPKNIMLEFEEADADNDAEMKLVEELALGPLAADGKVEET